MKKLYGADLCERQNQANFLERYNTNLFHRYKIIDIICIYILYISVYHKGVILIAG